MMVQAKASTHIGKKLFKLLSKGQVETAKHYEEYRLTAEYKDYWYKQAVKTPLITDVVMVITAKKNNSINYNQSVSITNVIYEVGEKDFVEDN